MFRTIIKSISRQLGPVYESIKSFLPFSYYLEYGGVKVPIQGHRLDVFFKLGNRKKYLNVRHLPNYEFALIRALKEYVKPMDRITIVGGGFGVTACVAKMCAGDSGKVICFEGNKDNCNVMRETFELNGVVDIRIRHAIVDSDIGVYEGAKSDELLSPKHLPDCDVLELDCEGAERGILEKLTMTPRVIIVETHGNFGSSTLHILELLQKLGYSVRFYGVAEPRVADYCIDNDIMCLIGVRPC